MSHLQRTFPLCRVSSRPCLSRGLRVPASIASMSFGYGVVPTLASKLCTCIHRRQTQSRACTSSIDSILWVTLRLRRTMRMHPLLLWKTYWDRTRCTLSYRCLIVFRQGKSCTTQCQLSTPQTLAGIAGRRTDGTHAACQLGSFRKSRPLQIRLDLECKVRTLKTLALKTRMLCKGCTLKSRLESMCCADIRRMHLETSKVFFRQGTFRSCASLGLAQTCQSRTQHTSVRVTRQRCGPQGSLYILCLRVALARGGKLGGTGALPW